MEVCLRHLRVYYRYFFYFNYDLFKHFAHFSLCICFQVPFLDATNTLLHPILPLQPADYEEFGYPGEIDDFHAIREYSSYDNIQKDALYPAVLISSSFNTR